MKAQDNKILSFRIVNLKSESNSMELLESNNCNDDPIVIQSKYSSNFKSWLSKFVADEIYPDYSWDNWNKVANCIMKTTMSVLPKYYWNISYESIWTPASVSVSICRVSVISSLSAFNFTVASIRPDSGLKVDHSGSKKHMLFSS